MSAIPLFSDLPSTKTRYNAGDRIVAKVTTDLSPAQYHKFYKSVKAFCQADVNLLVINTSKISVLRVRAGEQDLEIAARTLKTNESMHGKAQVDLARVEFKKDDQLIVRTTPVLYRPEVKRVFSQWAGSEVEVIFMQSPV